jgi:hypothetical protein
LLGDIRSTVGESDMDIRHLFASGVLAAGVFAAVSSANAGVVLTDNFDSGTAQANWPGDAIFQSVTTGGAAVDLVGPGFFQQLAYPPPSSTGNSVDLDGSTGVAGTLQSLASFGPGQYTLSFLMAGNLRGDVNKTTTISLGNWSTSLDLPSTSPYTPYSFTFSTTGGNLSFADNAAGNQNIGNLLDNVSLSTAVPELSTWGMLLLGFAGLGYAAFRRGRHTSAAIA